jgi:hypothetical protein
MRMMTGVFIFLLALALTGAPGVAGGASGTTATGPGFEELLAKAKQDMGTEKGTAYDETIGKQIETKHTATVSTCVQSAGPGEPAPFRAVIVVEKNGTVSEVALDPETEVAKCLRKALLQETFPEPPVAPFHDLMQMSFK